MTTKIEDIKGSLPDATKQALEQLEKEGHQIADDLKPNFGEDEQLIEGKIEDPEKKAPVDDEKPPEGDKKPDDDAPDGDKKPDEKAPGEKIDRKISFAPAWKLKVAEDQKAKLEKDLADTRAELAKLAGKPSDLTDTEKKTVDDTLKDLAEKHNMDPELIKDLRDTIVKGISTPAEITEKLKALETLQEERDRNVQETEYNRDFEKNVLPLIKAELPNISEDALSQVKEDLMMLAFTEEYGKISLDKIFKAERDSFKLPTPIVRKKSTENNGSGLNRSADVSFDELDEAGYLALSDDKKLEYTSYMAKKNRK